MQIQWPMVLTAVLALAGSACSPSTSSNSSPPPPNNTSSGDNQNATGPCEATACGPQAETARVCADGTSVASQCTRNAAGACEWQFDCAGPDPPAPTSEAAGHASTGSTSAAQDASVAESATPDAGASATSGRRRRTGSH